MKPLVFDSPYPDFEIVLLGDTHEGSVSSYDDGIDEAINYIAEKPNRYWVHMGDWIEAITTDDKRYMSDQGLDPIPIKQARRAAERFAPIATKCICGLMGNHELKLHRCGNLVRDIICDTLKIPYGAYLAHMDIRHDGEHLFNAMLWHGPAKGSIRSNAKDYEQREANVKAALKMRLKYMFSDCALQACGHLHRLIVVPPSPQLYIYNGENGPKQGYLTGEQQGKFIDPDRRWYACTGSFSKLYSDDDEAIGYAEVAGYPPVELGFIVVHVQDGQIMDIEKRVV